MRYPSLVDLFEYYFDRTKLRPRRQFPYDLQNLYLAIQALPPQELTEMVNVLYDIDDYAPTDTIPQMRMNDLIGWLARFMGILAKINGQAQMDISKSNEAQNRSIAELQKRYGGERLLEPDMIKEYYLYCIFNPHGLKPAEPKHRGDEKQALETMSPKILPPNPAFAVPDLPYYGPQKTLDQTPPASLIRQFSLFMVEEVHLFGSEHRYAPIDVGAKGGVFLLEICEAPVPIWTAVEYDKRCGRESKRVIEPFQWFTSFIHQKSAEPIKVRHVGKTIESGHFMKLKVYFRKRRQGER